MGDETDNWPNAVMMDGLAPVKDDPDDPVQANIVAVEAGPRRRKRVGEVVRGDGPHALYEYASTEVALVFDEAIGEFVYYPAGGLDALSDERVHRDQLDTLPLGATAGVDQAFAANDRKSAVTRRPRANAKKIGYKTIGRSKR